MTNRYAVPFLERPAAHSLARLSSGRKALVDRVCLFWSSLRAPAMFTGAGRLDWTEQSIAQHKADEWTGVIFLHTRQQTLFARR